MTSSSEHPSGFTLVELIVVLAVLGVLLGSAVPLVGSVLDSQRRQRVGSDLANIADALDAYYYDQGQFPTQLDDAGFLTTYLQPGVGQSVLEDPWGGNSYQYTRHATPDRVTVHSVGEDGADAGYAAEEHSVEVSGTPPGSRKTRQRMRVILEVLANRLEAGGTLTGSWATDRVSMGLGTNYANDGFGTAFTLDASSLILRSAGPDRSPNTADDLTN